MNGFRDHKGPENITIAIKALGDVLRPPNGTNISSSEDKGMTLENARAHALTHARTHTEREREREREH